MPGCVSLTLVFSGLYVGTVGANRTVAGILISSRMFLALIAELVSGLCADNNKTGGFKPSLTSALPEHRKVNMSYAKIGMATLNPPAKAAYLRRLAAGVTGNPNFTAPTPNATAILAKADAIDTSYNEAMAARLISKSKTSAMDLQCAEAEAMVAQLASYVDGASNGDATIIESAGFSTRATPSPIGELRAPTDLQVLPSEHSGSADVSWQSVRGAKAYSIERAEEAANLDYKVIGNSTKKQASLNSMVSGKKYWFRVAAIGSAGQSAWSDPVPLFAP